MAVPIPQSRDWRLRYAQVLRAVRAREADAREAEAGGRPPCPDHCYYHRVRDEACNRCTVFSHSAGRVATDGLDEALAITAREAVLACCTLLYRADLNGDWFTAVEVFDAAVLLGEDYIINQAVQLLLALGIVDPEPGAAGVGGAGGADEA